MIDWRTTWWAAAGLAAVAGAVRTPLTLDTTSAVAVLIALVLFGALMGWAVADELPVVRHPIALGIGTLTTPFIVPGLVDLLGSSAWALLGCLLLLSPYVGTPLRRLVVKRRLPTDTVRAGLAPPDEALRRQWLESSTQLRNAGSVEDRLLLVALRAQILDDLVDRNGGLLPDYVWTALRGDSGPDHATRTS